MRCVTGLLIGLLVVSSAWALPESERYTKFESGDLRMPVTDFLKMLEEMETLEKKVEEANKKVNAIKKKVPPPVPWALSDIHFNADATQGHQVRIDATINLQVWSDQWNHIPIVGNTVALKSATLNGEARQLLEHRGFLSLLTNEPGEYTLQCEFYVTAQEKDGAVTLSYPVQPASIMTMDLALAHKSLQLTAGNAAGIEKQSHEDGMRAALHFRHSDSIHVGWKLPAKPKPKVVVKPKDPPSVACTTDTFATFSETVLSLQTTVQCDVLKGALDGIQLSLPADVTVLKVEGTGLDWNTTTSGELQQLQIQLNHEVKDRYGFTLQYELPFQGNVGTLLLPQLTANAMTQQRGYIALATQGNVELEAQAEGDDLYRIDVTELPSTLHALAATPILHGFRFVKPKQDLTLSYHRLEDVPVRVAAIKRAELSSVITDNGKLMTRARFQVENQHQKFMRVNLGKDAEVWSTLVNNQPVKPARNSEEDSIMIPLLKSSDNAAARGGYPVEVVYYQPYDWESHWQGSYTVQAPETDIMIDRMHWSVYLPDEQLCYDSDGDLDALTGQMAPMELPGLGLSIKRTYPETIYRFKEGIERFFITDINNPAGSAMAQQSYHPPAAAEAAELKSLGYIDEDKDGVNDLEIGATASKGGRQPARRMAGILPMKAEIVETGQVYHFTRTVVPKDTPLEVRLDTVYAPALVYSVRGVQAILFLLGLLLAMRLLRSWKRNKSLVTPMVVTIFIAIALAITGGWLAQAKLFLLYWLLLGMGIYAAPSICAQLLQRIQHLGMARS